MFDSARPSQSDKGRRGINTTFSMQLFSLTMESAQREPLCSMHLMNTVADLKGGGGARPSLFGPNLPFLNEKLRQKFVILKISHKRPPPLFLFCFVENLDSPLN